LVAGRAAADIDSAVRRRSLTTPFLFVHDEDNVGERRVDNWARAQPRKKANSISPGGLLQVAVAGCASNTSGD
jgi:uncharacterized OsmC-like protein